MKLLILITIIILNVHVQQCVADFILNLLVYRQMQVENISYSIDDVPALRNVNISEYCKNYSKKCIWKCCPRKHIVLRPGYCHPAKGKRLNGKMAKLPIYDPKLSEVYMSDLNAFHIVSDYFSRKRYGMISLTRYFKPYLTKDGILYGELPNAFDRWKTFEVNQFCVDVTPRGKIIFFVDSSPLVENNRFKYSFYRIFALIACAILLTIVLIIYSILAHLRDMSGNLLKILVSCFLVVTTIEIGHVTIVIYDWISLIVLFESWHYFFNLAIFTWLNVMFYDVWRSLRNTRKGANSCTISGSKLFMKYCSYGFGVPLIMTICVLIIEYTDTTAVPWLITPKLNSLGTCEGFELLLYVYAPGFVLSLFNIYVCWFAVTTENWGSATHLPVTTRSDNKDRKHHLKRLAQYVKLMIFLTIIAFCKSYTFWNFEISPIVYTNIWLLGVVVMILFLRNKNIMKTISEKMCRTHDKKDPGDTVYA